MGLLKRDEGGVDGEGAKLILKGINLGQFLGPYGTQKWILKIKFYVIFKNWPIFGSFLGGGFGHFWIGFGQVLFKDLVEEMSLLGCSKEHPRGKLVT